MHRSLVILFGSVIVISGFGCGSSSTPTTTANANSNSVSAKEIKLDPANMPAGLSANQVQLPANSMPPGISANAVAMPIGNKPIPGIPTAEQLKKGFKPGKTSTPGIPDQETIRKQMGMPPVNVTPPTNSVPMMKSKRPVGGKPQ